MADDMGIVNVVDVYDEAAMIGKEFEQIIDNYGTESVTDLMPRVIQVLEQLEVFASKNERENDEVYELRLAVQRMENEKAERSTERMKYEKELEQIEDAWRTETKDLLEMVGKLQDENQRLKTNLSETKQQSENAVLANKAEEEDLRILTNLKITVDKQRDQIRSHERDVRQKTVDIEALHAQLERVTKVNTDLRRKNTLTTKQAKRMISDKAELQAQIQDKEQQIVKIKEIMNDQEDSPPTSANETSEDIEDRLSQLGKMVIDLKDPNRPRFTLNELREVLLERNELKTKLFEVEEELDHYKPKSEVEEQDLMEDLPAQGPINKEPFDKLYPDYKESGIRKFFKFFSFGRSSPKTQKKTKKTATSNHCNATNTSQPSGRINTLVNPSGRAGKT